MGNWLGTFRVYKPSIDEPAGTELSGAFYNFDTSLTNIYNKLWRDNVINVKSDYGAAGDGETDDTAAIQAAVAGASSSNGATIFFPAGKYVVKDQIIINKDGILIKGEGPRHGKAWVGDETGSFIIPKDTITGAIFKFTYITGTTVSRGCGIEDLSFLDNYGSGPSQGGRQYSIGAAVHVHACDQFYMNNVEFTNLKGRAIYTQRCMKSKFNNVEIFWSGDTSKPALDINEIDASNSTTACIFNNFTVEDCFLDDYISISANSGGNIFSNFIFEAYHSETDTEQIFIDCDSARNFFSSIKMNQNQGALDRFHVDGNENIIKGLFGLGSNPAGHIIKISSHYNILDGFHFNGASGSVSQQSIHITNSALYNRIANGTIVYCGGITIDANCLGNSVSDVTFYSGTGKPVYTSGAETSLANLHIDALGGAGPAIYIGASYCNVISCNIIDSSTITKGIHAYYGGALISNNRFKSLTNGSLEAIDNDGNNSSIVGNHFVGVTKAITDTGNSTLVNDNFGANETFTAASGNLQHWGYSSLDTTSNAIAGTLPDGKYIGQRKTMVMTTRPGSDDAVITVTHHVTADGGTYTFNAVDEAVILEWTGTEWIEIKNQDATWASP